MLSNCGKKDLTRLVVFSKKSVIKLLELNITSRSAMLRNAAKGLTEPSNFRKPGLIQP
jgi:hypothetical protein